MTSLHPASTSYNVPSAALLSVLIATGGLGLMAEGAIAQEIFYDSASGVVRVDNNAFDFQTGELNNGSNIALPDRLPIDAREGVSLPPRPGVFAPNSIELTTDVDYINGAFNNILSQENPRATYQLQTETLELTTQFDVNYGRGNHAFGEGITVTVFNEDGSVKSEESAFVRGDRVQFNQGDRLPESAQVTASYGADETVELRVLNIREDNAAPNESAIYFTEDGRFIVEDLQDGGDRDFNDGDYLQISGGRGEALTLEEISEVVVEDLQSETPLAPETRQEERLETEVVRTLREVETDEQSEKTFGSVEAPDTIADRLGHASAALTEAGEYLIYDRYTAESEVRLGSDGVGVTGQLAPLIKNPSAPPTLLHGNLNFNPFVGDNEAGLSATVGVTQFLNRTHRQATDVFGNVIEPASGDDRLLEPTGLLNNQRWVGYVPPTQSETVLGSQIFSRDGIFELPSDRAVVIAPADPTRVGRGDSAYTDNVGGLLIEGAAGEITFVPQWANNGYAQTPISLEAQEATRMIYALVPQQTGQALQVGGSYAVTRQGNGYQIADGGFKIIAADQYPQNFVQEMPEVYAVEDTLPDGNAVTSLFNGVQGIYAETLGGQPVPTVDVGLAAEADARVGNMLFPMDVVVGDVGQNAYRKTTRAAGFYLGGALTGGLGNQQDTVQRTTTTIARDIDEMRQLRTLDTFFTPLTQVDSSQRETTTTAQNTGTALFDINSQGELENVRFVEGTRTTTDVSSIERNVQQRLVRGEEFLASSVTAEENAPMVARLVSADEETTTETDSQANFSAVQGEIALGGVFNFGNTPWTTAANTVRAELFAKETVIGRRHDGGIGWRAEVLFHPFGEVQREAYQYDASGRAIALYETEPVYDSSGAQLMETLMSENGESVAVPVNRFVLDENGDRTPQKEGIGRAQGPGVYLRLEDVFSSGVGPQVAGGIQFSF